MLANARQDGNTGGGSLSRRFEVAVCAANIPGPMFHLGRVGYKI
jgi:hypothetical protein